MTHATLRYLIIAFVLLVGIAIIAGVLVWQRAGEDASGLVQGEAEGWQTYKNEDLGIIFSYPSSWTGFELKFRYMRKGNYYFTTSNENISNIIFNNESKRIAFSEGPTSFSPPEPFSGNLVSIISSGKMHMAIRDFPSSMILSLFFSPKGDYLALDAWNGDSNKDSESHIINVNTGESIGILEKYDGVYYRSALSGISWSPNGDYMIVNSSYSASRERGSNAILLSERGNPNNLDVIFSPEADPAKGRELHADFIDDDTLEIVDFVFSSGVRSVKRYNVISKTLSNVPEGKRLYKNDVYGFSFEYPKSLPELKETEAVLSRKFFVEGGVIVEQESLLPSIIHLGSYSLNDGSLSLSIFSYSDYQYSCPPGGINSIYDSETDTWWDVVLGKVEIGTVVIGGIKGYEVGCGDGSGGFPTVLLPMEEKDIMLMLSSGINGTLGQNGEAGELVRSTFRFTD